MPVNFHFNEVNACCMVAMLSKIEIQGNRQMLPLVRGPSRLPVEADGVVAHWLGVAPRR